MLGGLALWGVAQASLAAAFGPSVVQWLTFGQIFLVLAAVPLIGAVAGIGMTRAAYAAGLATGFWSGTEDLVRNWTADKRWHPAMEADERTRLYGEWCKAVGRSLDWK